MDIWSAVKVWDWWGVRLDKHQPSRGKPQGLMRRSCSGLTLWRYFPPTLVLHTANDVDFFSHDCCSAHHMIAEICSPSSYLCNEDATMVTSSVTAAASNRDHSEHQPWLSVSPSFVFPWHKKCRQTSHTLMLPVWEGSSSTLLMTLSHFCFVVLYVLRVEPEECVIHRMLCISPQPPQPVSSKKWQKHNRTQSELLDGWFPPGTKQTCSTYI